MTKEQAKQKLQTIQAKWECYIKWEDENPGSIFRSNMLHAMSGSMQNCYDLIWLIKTLEEVLNEKKEVDQESANSETD